MNVHPDVSLSTRYGFMILWAGWHRRNVMTIVCGRIVRKREGIRLIWRFKKHGVTTVGISLILIMKMGSFEIHVD